MINSGIEDLGFAKVDHGRHERTLIPEVVFCKGKTPKQAAEILFCLTSAAGFALATRATIKHYEAVKKAVPRAKWHETAKMISCLKLPIREDDGHPIIVATAGTSDIPVAEEAVVTLNFLGFPRVEKLYDVGVAGLDRLLAHRNLLANAKMIIAVAGMDGVLPSVVAGLTPALVVGVPRDGVSQQTMLHSCSPGVTVVNINNGFGAACVVAKAFRSWV